MTFPYAFGRPHGRVGYRVRTVHRSHHVPEGADWSYDLMARLIRTPEQFRPCGVCGPVMSEVAAASATALAEYRERQEAR
jgi:hypothetical protein